jgi:hypothetical protein
LDTLSTDPVFEHLVSLFLIYGFPLISFTYCFNFLFKDFGSAQTWIFLSFILSGTILTTLIYVCRLFDTTRPIGIGLSYFFKLFPPYLFGCTILGKINLLKIALIQKLMRSTKGFLPQISTCMIGQKMGKITSSYVSMLFFTSFSLM